MSRRRAFRSGLARALAAGVAVLCCLSAAPPAASGAESLIMPRERPASSAAVPALSTAPSSWQVCFSPPLPNGCDPLVAIKDAIADARSTILVQAYSFTSRPIARALLRAHRRGVTVRVILDRSQLSGSFGRYELRVVDALDAAGIPEYLDESESGHHLAHNKVMIIDDRTVITGSYNFTASAEHGNAENLLVIQDPALAGEYTQNWNYHVQHSTPFVARWR